MSLYDATSLDAELKAAGLQINGCNSIGGIHWVGVPTAQNLTDAAAVLSAHNPTARATAETNAYNALKAIKQSALFDDGAWAGFTAGQRADFIRTVLQKLVKREIGEMS